MIGQVIVMMVVMAVWSYLIGFIITVLAMFGDYSIKTHKKIWIISGSIIYFILLLLYFLGI